MAVKRSVFEEVGLFRGMPEVGDTAIIHDLLFPCLGAHIIHVPDAKVTHLEVQTFCACLQKLKQCGEYTRDYVGVHVFRPLNIKKKFKIMISFIQENSYGFKQRLQLVYALISGVSAFERGRKQRNQGLDVEEMV